MTCTFTKVFGFEDFGGLSLVALSVQPHQHEWSSERIAAAAGSTVSIWLLHSKRSTTASEATRAPATATPPPVAECVASLDEHDPNYLVTVRWSPCGKTLASCDPWRILLWRLDTIPPPLQFGQRPSPQVKEGGTREYWKLKSRLASSANDDLFDLSWLGEDFIVAGAIDGLRIWNVHTADMVKSFDFAHGFVKGIACHGERLIAAESNDRRATVWSVDKRTIGGGGSTESPRGAANGKAGSAAGTAKVKFSLKQIVEVQDLLAEGPEDPPFHRRCSFEPRGHWAAFPFGERLRSSFGFAAWTAVKPADARNAISAAAAAKKHNSVDGQGNDKDKDGKHPPAGTGEPPSTTISASSEPWRFRGHESRINGVSFAHTAFRMAGTATARRRRPAASSTVGAATHFTYFVQASVDGALSLWRWSYFSTHPATRPHAKCLFVFKPPTLDQQASFVDLSWTSDGKKLLAAASDGSVNLIAIEHDGARGALVPSACWAKGAGDPIAPLEIQAMMKQQTAKSSTSAEEVDPSLSKGTTTAPAIKSKPPTITAPATSLPAITEFLSAEVTTGRTGSAAIASATQMPVAVRGNADVAMTSGTTAPASSTTDGGQPAAGTATKRRRIVPTVVVQPEATAPPTAPLRPTSPLRMRLPGSSPKAFPVPQQPTATSAFDGGPSSSVHGKVTDDFYACEENISQHSSSGDEMLPLPAEPAGSPRAASVREVSGEASASIPSGSAAQKTQTVPVDSAPRAGTPSTATRQDAIDELNWFPAKLCQKIPCGCGKCRRNRSVASGLECMAEVVAIHDATAKSPFRVTCHNVRHDLPMEEIPDGAEVQNPSGAWIGVSVTERQSLVFGNPFLMESSSASFLSTLVADVGDHPTAFNGRSTENFPSGPFGRTMTDGGGLPAVEKLLQDNPLPPSAADEENRTLLLLRGCAVTHTLPLEADLLVLIATRPELDGKPPRRRLRAKRRGEEAQSGLRERALAAAASAADAASSFPNESHSSASGVEIPDSIEVVSGFRYQKGVSRGKDGWGMAEPFEAKDWLWRSRQIGVSSIGMYTVELRSGEVFPMEGLTKVSRDPGKRKGKTWPFREQHPEVRGGVEEDSETSDCERTPQIVCAGHDGLGSIGLLMAGGIFVLMSRVVEVVEEEDEYYGDGGRAGSEGEGVCRVNCRKFRMPAGVGEKCRRNISGETGGSEDRDLPVSVEMRHVQVEGDGSRWWSSLRILFFLPGGMVLMLIPVSNLFVRMDDLQFNKNSFFALDHLGNSWEEDEEDENSSQTTEKFEESALEGCTLLEVQRKGAIRRDDSGGNQRSIQGVSEMLRKMWLDDGKEDDGTCERISGRHAQHQLAACAELGDVRGEQRWMTALEMTDWMEH